MATSQGAPRVLSGRRGRPSPTRRPQPHAGAPRLREPDRDGLPRRARAVLAPAHVMHLFPHELTGLGRGRLALTLVPPGPLHRSLFRHRILLMRGKHSRCQRHAMRIGPIGSHSARGAVDADSLLPGNCGGDYEPTDASRRAFQSSTATGMKERTITTTTTTWM